MKFKDVSHEAQLALLSGAIAGLIEVFTKDQSDEGREVLNLTLKQIGLTESEYGSLLSDLSPGVEREMLSVMSTANEVEDEDEDEDEDPEDADDSNADGWENLHEDRVCLVCNHEYCKCE